MKNSEYTYTCQGKPAMTCEENFAFGAERYADRLRQAEINRRVNAATRPEVPSTPITTAVLKRLAALGQAIFSL